MKITLTLEKGSSESSMMNNLAVLANIREQYTDGVQIAIIQSRERVVKQHVRETTYPRTRSDGAWERLQNPAKYSEEAIV